MTDDLKTKLEGLADKAVENCPDEQRPEKKELFLRGSQAVIDQLWRSPEEPPQPGRELIVKSTKGMKIYPNPQNGKMSWEFFARIARIISWAYSEDILPEKEKEGT